jgi:c-di-GMP-binding flagellar brake protein YcgR
MVRVVIGHQSEARRREGYLNENLQITVQRIGSEMEMRSALDVLHLGHSLGVRPLDDPAELDDFQPNDAIRARFARPSDATYRFSSRVLEVDGAGSLLWLASPVNIERIQSRRHVRVPSDAVADLALAGPRRLSDAKHHFHGSARVVDISAGGAAILSTDVLPLGSTVLLDTVVPDRKGHLKIATRARVVRSAIATEPAEQTRYRYGLEYIDLASPHEAALVAAVFWQLGQQRVL